MLIKLISFIYNIKTTTPLIVVNKTIMLYNIFEFYLIKTLFLPIKGAIYLKNFL